jgi:cobaltochelatase CobS
MTTTQQLPNTQNAPDILQETPDEMVLAKDVFGINCDFSVPAFSKKSPLVPQIDKSYKFDELTTKAVLAGFIYNKRVMLQGYHGTGKSTHIEQIAARLNWPCVRINLDSHVSRIDLLGKDAIVLEDGKQVTQFQEGVLPWSIQRPVALVFDEYDAGRADVMFVIQRILEQEGKLTLLDQNKVITPNPYFRLFSTCNTIGLGDTTGLYHGTQQINQGQMDRWNIVSSLNYLKETEENNIVLSKFENVKPEEKETISNMIDVANLTRKGFINGEISTVMSPRTVINWAQNNRIFNDLDFSFKVTFLNKCDETEKLIVAEYYQRCMAQDINF